jgi:hypothetical protein
MRDLWHRTVELIRTYPVLSLPAIWAACLSYGWEQLRRIILHNVLPLVLYRTSVLGASVPDTSPSRVAVLYVLSLSNTVVLQYADICGYVVALLITAKMLGRLTADNPKDAPYANISIASHWSGVLWLGLLAYVVAFGSVVIFIFLPIAYFPAAAHHLLSILKRPYFMAPTGFITYAALAYFLTPVALRLLSRLGKRGISCKEIATGRKSWLITGAAITALSFIQLSTPKPFDANLAERAAVGLFWTIFVSLPYVPLFIALSLLGGGFSKEMSPLEESSGTQPYGEPSLQSE